MLGPYDRMYAPTGHLRDTRSSGYGVVRPARRVRHHCCQEPLITTGVQGYLTYENATAMGRHHCHQEPEAGLSYPFSGQGVKFDPQEVLGRS
jgi:hypothetical protein